MPSSTAVLMMAFSSRFCLFFDARPFMIRTLTLYTLTLAVGAWPDRRPDGLVPASEATSLGGDSTETTCHAAQMWLVRN